MGWKCMESSVKKYAVIDLGSNTIRISVYEVQGGSRFHLLFSEKEMAGLAGYVEKGTMTQAGLERACEALQNFQHLLQVVDTRLVYVFATASLRNINNTLEAVDYLEARTGLRIDVLSGTEEARLGYLGALAAGGLEKGVLFDIGGGSTEIVQFDRGVILQAQSLEIGSLNLFRRNVSGIMPKKSEQEQIRLEIQEKLEEVKLTGAPFPQLCGVGGTARAVLKLGRLRYGLDAMERTVTMEQLRELTELVQGKGRRARDMILRACPDRIHTIIPGMLLMETLCSSLGCREIRISPYGVREGYLCQKLKNDTISATHKTGNSAG